MNNKKFIFKKKSKVDNLWLSFLFKPDIFLMMIWLFTLIWYVIFEKTFVPLRVDFLFHLFLFISFFAIFYRLVCFTLKRIRWARYKLKPFLNKGALYSFSIFFIVLSLLNFYWVIYSTGIASAIDLRNIIADAEGNTDQVNLYVGISFPIAIVSYYIAHRSCDEKYKVLFIISSLILAIISTAKIFILLWMFYMIILNADKLNFNALILFLILAISLFGASSVVLDKFSSSKDSGVIIAILDTFNVYLLGGVASFQQILAGEHQGDDWTHIGMWYTNVHTAFAGWYAFAGDFFSVLYGSILGFYYAIFSNCNKLLSDSFIIYSVFLLYCIFMTVFADQYLLSYKMHIAYIFGSLLASTVKIKTSSKEIKSIADR